MQDENEIVSRAMFFRILRELYGFDDKKSILSNYGSLQKMSEEISFFQKELRNYKKPLQKQGRFIDWLLKDPIFKQKKKQKAFLRWLKMGKEVGIDELKGKKKFYIKKTRLQTENQWKNSISKLKGGLETTLSMYEKEYFSFEIKTRKVGQNIKYRLIVNEGEKYPYRIVR